MLAKTLTYNSGEPFVARAAGRSVVGTLNALIVGLIRAHLRMQRIGTPVTELTIDSRAEHVEGAIAESEMAERMREEQGHAVVREEPLKAAARLKLVRDVIAADLEKNAGERVLPIGDGKAIKDPFHMAQRFEETLEFMATNVQEVSEATVKMTAEALGCTEDEVRQALLAAPQRDQAFLTRNKDEIIAIYQSLVAADKDGYEMDATHFEAVIESLPPMQRLAVHASADRALHKEWSRQLVDFTRSGHPLTKSNLGLIQGVRRELRKHMDSWFKDEAFAREVQEAVARGARIPALGPVPAPAAKDEPKRTGTSG